jgi:MoaA/NifB/PqqE/SkfB family radical SAM enzyme
MVRFRIHFEPMPIKTRAIPKEIRILAFNITDKCNLKCPHCFAEDNRRELNTQECQEVIRQAKDANCVRVILCGKEPLMRKDIFEILLYIRDMGMDVELMTNGILVNNTVIEDLINCGIKKVQVSIDGFEGTHDTIRGMDGAYNGAINAIRLLLKNGFETSVNSVILEKNKDELPKLIDKLKTNFPNLNEIRFSRLIPTRIKNPDFNYFKTYIETLKNIMAVLEKLKIKYYIEIEDNPIVFNDIISDNLKDKTIFTPCGVITHTIDVLTNGDVVFCVPMGSHQKPVIHGNVLHDGLDTIIKNTRKYHDNSVDDEVCHSCEHYKVRCLGGCRCVAYAYRQNEYLADPFCPRVREFSG